MGLESKLLPNWMMRHWRPATALIYTVICVFDFIIFPALISTRTGDLLTLANEAAHLDVQVQRDLIMASTRAYQPITLLGGGMFHIAFGAIITGATLSKKPDIVGDDDWKRS